jgi:hypothetical protein
MHVMRIVTFLAAFALVGCASASAGGPAGTASAASAASTRDEKRGETPDGRVGVHGMVVFGSPSHRVFMSHIPMFKPPHDYQLVVEVELPDTRALPASFADGLYTFEPKPFALDALRKGELRVVEGTIFRGNFEDGGVPLVKDARVGIRRVVGTPHPLVDAPPRPTVLEYIVFGSPEEAFVVHPIGKGAAFDQIARVRAVGLEAAHLEDGIVVVVPGRSNDVASRLGGGAHVTGYAAAGRAVSLSLELELSCLVGPDFASRCR